MKRPISRVLCLAFLASFAACSKSGNETKPVNVSVDDLQGYWLSLSRDGKESLVLSISKSEIFKLDDGSHNFVTVESWMSAGSKTVGFQLRNVKIDSGKIERTSGATFIGPTRLLVTAFEKNKSMTLLMDPDQIANPSTIRYRALPLSELIAIFDGDAETVRAYFENPELLALSFRNEINRKGQKQPSETLNKLFKNIGLESNVTGL